MTSEHLAYFKGNTLAADVWYNKYRAEGEITPEDTLRRVSKELARVIKNGGSDIRVKNNLSPYGKKRKELTEERIYQLLKDFETIIPQGSILASAGIENIASMSNCVTLDSPYDSYGGILYVDEQLAQLSKRRCGVGVDISTLRPKNSEVTNAAKSSTGATSFMERFSNTIREVAQNGRRGALMLTIDCRHPDILEFITIKNDLTKVTGANISVRWHDDFIIAAQQNKDYILRFPVDASPDEAQYTKTVNAKDIWLQFCKSAHQSAEPGCLFWDHVIKYGTDSPYVTPTTTNPCQPEFATILTPTGIKILRDVSVGDTIWSGKKWTKIIDKWSTGIKPVYRYLFSFGEFIGTDNHRVLQYGEKVMVKNATSVDALPGPVEHRHKDLDPQIIMDGLLIGDGSVHKASNNLIYLLVGSNDHDYFDSEISHLLLKDRTRSFASDKNYLAFEVKTTLTYKDLPYTYDRLVPTKYIKGTQDEIKAFLRGLFSANGSVINGRRITLKQSSKELIRSVQVMLSAIGIRSYVTINKPSEIVWENGVYESKESYDLNISQDRYLFLQEIGFIQDYKNKAVIGDTVNKLNSGVFQDVEYLGAYEVYDITVEDEEHTYWTGGLHVSNCGEIPMPQDTCRLVAANLMSMVTHPFTNEAYFADKRAYEIFYEAQVIADAVVSLEIEAMTRIIKKIENDPEPYHIKQTELQTWTALRDTAIKYRRTGTGFVALGDMLASLNMKYGDYDTIKFIEKLMEIKMQAEWDASIDLAIIYGHFSGFDFRKEEHTPFVQLLKLISIETYERMKLYGRRNISISTVAPTGSISQIAKIADRFGTTSGIEPVYMLKYIRRRKLEDNATEYDYIDDATSHKWKQYTVFHPGYEIWCEIRNKDPHKEHEGNPYIEAGNLTPEERVQTQAAIQRYTTHSISSTVNLKAETSVEEIERIYMLAWANNLKGITVYRDGSRSGVLVSTEEKNNEIKYNEAVKRPRTLPCNVHETWIHGKRWYTLVGLLDEKPYEIFAFRYDRDLPDLPKTAKITKNGKKHYTLHNGDVLLENISSLVEEGGLYKYSEEQNQARLISTLLRHNVDPKHIVDQMTKVAGTLGSFSRAMVRTLINYVENNGDHCPECGGEVIYEDGCAKCTCGWNKC